MALKRFVCLANSFKEGGRCLAGIELDSENNPVFENGRPKWLRPVSSLGHGAIDTDYVSQLKILDVVEFDMGEFISRGTYQCENVSYLNPIFNTVGTFDIAQLRNLCDNRFQIFGNKGKAIIEDKIGLLNHSLLLINPSEFEVYEKVYSDSQYPQQRLMIKYNGYQYDLPITDPVFLRKYQADPAIMDDIRNIYVSLSVGVLHEGWYNKLVAGIIPYIQQPEI